MMLIYAGIDEAGYGPMFGPLCVASSVIVLDKYNPEEGEPDMWSMLDHIICRKRRDAKHKIAINDSKKLKSSAKNNSLTHLERGVLTFLSMIEDSIPEIDSNFFEKVSCKINLTPWYESSTKIPIGNDLNTLRIDAAKLRRELGKAHIRCPLMKCTAIDTDAYNKQTKYAKKSSLNFSVAMQHVNQIMQQFGNMHPRIMIDRHGGRIRYRNDLQLCWPEASIQVLVENKSMSRYRLTHRGNKLTITFASKSDEKHMPVALASMLAKYTRELHMIRFNRYFSEEIPNLRPTAGYVQDGRRFLKEIEPVLVKNGVQRAQLVRSS